MKHLLKSLLKDENGVILSTEIVIVGTLLVLGLITGLACLQKSVNAELQDLAGAFSSLDQSYAYSGHRKSVFGRSCGAYSAGSSWSNARVVGCSTPDIIGCPAEITDECLSTPCLNCADSAHASTGCTACGGCGRIAVHGASCNSANAFGTPGQSRCLDTGVPRMRVSEFQGATSVTPVTPQADACFHIPAPVVPLHADHPIAAPCCGDSDIQFPGDTLQPVPESPADPQAVPPSPVLQEVKPLSQILEIP